MEKVIFDTNAYRYLVANKTNRQVNKIIQKLKDKERKNSIESLMSPIVAKELLAHVANKKDPSYHKCLKAIKALYYHSGTDKEISIMPSSELLISKAFFHQEISSKIETHQAIAQVLMHLARNPSQHIFKKFQRNLNLNAKHVKDAEDVFATEMKTFLKKIDPNFVDWKVFKDEPKKRTKALKDVRAEETSIAIATGYLYIVYKLLVQDGKRPNKSDNDIFTEIAPMAEEFLNIFPEPIALYKVVLENLINSEFNLFEDSRSNFVWDIHLMFNVGQNTIGNSRIIFVTSDAAIIKSAMKTNSKNTILTFEEYMEYLGLK
ncbi:hypothetical protein AR687_24210 [Flavobacteriaceae bacterium CRH]|nr:hypothetical protein AR687_24210 [Flavobacteriaceae bacterium CRH]